jgi:ethanolamine ammonia-lyase large subunit
MAFRLADPRVQQQAAQYSGSPEIRYEYTLICNINDGGLPAMEAGSVVAEKAMRILTHQAAGNRLEEILAQ